MNSTRLAEIESERLAEQATLDNICVTANSPRQPVQYLFYLPPPCAQLQFPNLPPPGTDQRTRPRDLATTPTNLDWAHQSLIMHDLLLCNHTIVISTGNRVFFCVREQENFFSYIVATYLPIMNHSSCIPLALCTCQTGPQNQYRPPKKHNVKRFFFGRRFYTTRSSAARTSPKKHLGMFYAATGYGVHPSQPQRIP